TCGGSNVSIQNLATAALYDYTPYQPNAAVLAAPMGTTVTCGAYGNINFYRYFTSWFGAAVLPVSNVYIQNGVYSLKNQNSSTYLNVANGSSIPGAKIWIYHADGTTAENWLITRNPSNGYYSLQNVGSGNYLDVTDGNLNPGAQLQSWTGN
ncbi:MAG TPA: RICIN domain-containing protein, partial [Dongiaceae bacterium]|nr:RICIN domain-containing protein [Dongiaceae bacterium]